MGYLVAGSTARLTFTANAPLSALTLAVTDAGTTLDLGQPSNPSGDKLTWTLDVQSANLPSSLDYHTLALAWRQTLATGQIKTTTESFDVLPREPLGPWLVDMDTTRTYLDLERGADDPLVFSLLEMANVMVEQEVGRDFAVIERTEQVIVPPRGSVLKVRNFPVTALASIVDPYGATYISQAFVPDWAAGIIRRFFVNLGQSYLAATFGPSVVPPPDSGHMSPLLPGSWTVTYTGGLAASPDWDSRIAPFLSVLVLMAVSDFYNVRTARATSETEGDHSHTLDQTLTLPGPVAAGCRKFSTQGL